MIINVVLIMFLLAGAVYIRHFFTRERRLKKNDWIPENKDYGKEKRL